MIIALSSSVSPSQIKEVCRHLREWGYQATILSGLGEQLVGAIAMEETVDEFEAAERVRTLPGVDEVLSVGKPYRLVARESRSEPSKVTVASVVLGDGSFRVIAGPCSIESFDQLIETARFVQRNGASLLRAGAFKPSTSPYGFQGLGREALEMLSTVKTELGIGVVTELMDVRELDSVSRVADMIQIGTRNMQNYDLLREVGRTRIPVLLKRGMMATLEEWLLAAEYIAKEGNESIVLCERGIRTFERHTRNTLDLSAVPAIKELSHLPVIVDPSHGTGRRSLVPPMTLAAAAAGADGALIEVHPDPDSAIKDGMQSLMFEAFARLMLEVRTLCDATRASGLVRKVA
jgi:3-deoxy-7-phosphoheptulonate synthase